MQPWFPASLGAAALIAVHYLFLRNASGRIDDVLGALVLEATAAIGIALAYVLGQRGGALPMTRGGVVSAMLSGFAISGASILLFSTMRRGGPVATTGTIVLGGGVTLSALLAPWIFHEAFGIRRAVGVALGIAAIVVLSRDR